MLVRFDILDERQRDTLVKCLNMTKVRWEEENDSALKLAATTHPMALVIMKVADEFLNQMSHDATRPIHLSAIEREYAIKNVVSTVNVQRVFNLDEINYTLTEVLDKMGKI